MPGDRPGASPGTLLLVGRDIPLGRFAGIKVSMSWTVPVVGVFYAITLAKNRFPIEVPGQSSTAYWTVGVAGAVLFFTSLLAHEVGHALVARREGIGVEGISLWLLGGLAKLEHEAESAGAELRVAVIGPVTSAGVGVAFLLIGQAIGGSTGLLGLFAHLFGWLAFINLLLAAFNLLPGVPLDGGRVLSALLWMRTGNQTWSQGAGARFGQVLGAALMGLGLYVAVDGHNSNGWWVVFVGFYIFGSASSEARSNAATGLLRDVQLGEVMEADPPVLPDWMTVHDLVTNAGAYLPHTAFVVRGVDGRVTGLLTAEAVQAADPRSWPVLRLSDLAFPVDRLLVASVHDSVLVTMQRARKGVSGRVLVLWPDGRIAGVTGADIGVRAAAVSRGRAATAPTGLPPVPAVPAVAWDPSRTATPSAPPTRWGG